MKNLLRGVAIVLFCFGQPFAATSVMALAA